MDLKNLEKLCKLVRYDILTSTTAAGSGHPTSSLSAVELITSLFFGGFYHFDLKNPKNIANDRFILSKGHASPLLYSLYHAAGAISHKELMTLRKFKSPLQGHPTPIFPYADVATGSLGQGLSVGVGMAMGIDLRIKNGELKTKRVPKIWVLMGDSEMAEGQVWEAAEIAAYYRLNNLVGIIDVNRLGQQGQTQYGWDVHNYEEKVRAFGWEPIVVKDGHDLRGVISALKKASLNHDGDTKPKMIIAKTIKGKGVSFLENKEGWHGKTLDKEQLKSALKELGKVDIKVRGKISRPNFQSNSKNKIQDIVNKLKSFAIGVEKNGFLTARTQGALMGMNSRQNLSQRTATREAYGDSLVKIGNENPDIVVLDAEVANSTFENKFQKTFPDRFFEMFIAEENMIGVALGFSKMGFIPYVSTFAAFLTQTFNQVRMSQYSMANLKIVGSHAGVSIGQDGPSQMGLEDISMFRSILSSVVFYPSDSVSAEKLTKIMAKNPGIFYMRTTREKTPVIYDEEEEFKIGGSKIHYSNKKKPAMALIIAAGITLHEAIKAQKHLANKNIPTVVVDLYSVKPFDRKTVLYLADQAKKIIVVEDHYPTGGIGEAIGHMGLKFKHLCVHKIPMSGAPEELLRFEEIDAASIIKSVLSSLSNG